MLCNWKWMLVTAGAVLLFGVGGAAARPEIPIFGDGMVAYCGGVWPNPVGGVLNLNSSCVLNLQITWVSGMKSAYLDYSVDGGATWLKEPLPVEFAPVSAGLVSGAGFSCYSGLPSGTYLFRAHGFHSPSEKGDLLSAPFPYSVALTCS